MKKVKIGARFRKLREELDTMAKDCTQDTLANLISIKKPQISELENGKREPSIKELKAYSKYFKVPMEYLLGMSDSRYYENINIAGELGLSDEAISYLKDRQELQTKLDAPPMNTDVINLLLSTGEGLSLLNRIYLFLFFNPDTFEMTVGNKGPCHSDLILVKDVDNNCVKLSINDVESFITIDIQNSLRQIKNHVKNKDIKPTLNSSKNTFFATRSVAK